LGRIAGRLAGCKVVHTVHMSSLYWNNRWPRSWLHSVAESLLTQLTHRTIFVSHSTYQLYLARRIISARQASCIPNGIDLASFTETQQQRYTLAPQLRQAWSIPPDAPIVLFVGRYSFQKGLDSLISAFGNIATDYPTAHLVLVGDGPSAKSWRAKSPDLPCKGA